MEEWGGVIGGGRGEIGEETDPMRDFLFNVDLQERMRESITLQ